MTKILVPSALYRSPTAVATQEWHVVIYLYDREQRRVVPHLCNISAEGIVGKYGGVMFDEERIMNPETRKMCPDCELRLAVFHANNPPDAEMRVLPLIPALQRMLFALSVVK